MANWEAPAVPDVPPRSRRGSEIYSLHYYHPGLKNMEDVRQVLVPFLQENGYFLVRNSFSKKDTFTVSVMHERSIKHFNIGRNPNGYYLQDKLFPSLDQLIRHHAAEDVPNVEGVNNVRLVYPVIYDGSGGRPDSLSLRSAGSISSINQRGSPVASRHPTEHTDNFSSGSGSPVSTASRRSFGSRTSVSPGSPPSEDVALPLQPNANANKRDKPQGKDLKSGLFTRVFRRDKSTESLANNKSGSVPREMSLPALPTQPADEIPRNRTSADSILQRPPPPVPQEHLRSMSESDTAPLYDRSVYSRVENATDRSGMLAQALRRTDTSTKCECGLELEDSELPRQWSIHISHEESTKGRIFFEGPRGQTLWNLPLDISLELSIKQQEFIRKLLMDVRMGKLPPPAPHGEVASSDNTDSRGAGAFNNSQSSSSGDSTGARDAAGPAAQGRDTSANSFQGASAAHSTDQNSNVSDKYPGRAGPRDNGTWC